MPADMMFVAALGKSYKKMLDGNGGILDK